MEGGGRLELVPASGDSGLARDAAETGFVVLLEIWHSALGELVGDVPPGQLRVLLIVSRAGSISIGRLAGALGASVPEANRICARMEAAGLLGRSTSAAGGDVPAALARWERGQLSLGQTLLARCRDIGDSSQVHGTFRPGDQRLIFGLYEPGH